MEKGTSKDEYELYLRFGGGGDGWLSSERFWAAHFMCQSACVYILDIIRKNAGPCCDAHGKVPPSLEI